jgi:hypothetical protein
MAKKTKKRADQSASDLWVAPRYSLKGPAGERGFEDSPGGLPTTNRFLELADIALGLKKSAKKKKAAAAAVSTHDTSKIEPYSH